MHGGHDDEGEKREEGENCRSSSSVPSLFLLRRATDAGTRAAPRRRARKILILRFFLSPRSPPSRASIRARARRAACTGAASVIRVVVVVVDATATGPLGLIRISRISRELARSRACTRARDYNRLRFRTSTPSREQKEGERERERPIASRR